MYLTMAASNRRVRLCRHCCTSCLNDQWEGRGLEHEEFPQTVHAPRILWTAIGTQPGWLPSRSSTGIFGATRGVFGPIRKKGSHSEEATRLESRPPGRARKQLEEVESAAYAEKLRGTLGAEPIEAYL